MSETNKVTYSPLNIEAANAADVEKYAQEILAEREDQASFADEGQTFEYFGIEQNLDALLTEFDSTIKQYRVDNPQPTFVLEYHHSCVNHTDEDFHLFTFTLSQQSTEQNTNNRHYQIITWKAAAEMSSSESETKIRAFMKKHQISDLPESSGVVSNLDVD
jgi:hypothetical protein